MGKRIGEDMEDLELTPTQAGRILGVGPRTVNNAADMGLIECHRTVGGHRRYWRSVVMRHYHRGTFDDAAAIAAKRRKGRRR